MTEPGGNWERDVIEKLASAALQEQRRARRWGIFFKSLTFAYLFILMFVALGWIGDANVSVPGPHTAVVDLSGVIATDNEASAEGVVAGLRAANRCLRSRGRESDNRRAARR